MSPKELNQRFNRAPVIIELTSGAQIYIPHREFVAVGNGDVISCFDTDGNHHLIDVINIADIIVMKKPKAEAEAKPDK